MRKMILFADLHAHMFDDFSYILPGGQDSRLSDILNVLRSIREICEDEHCNVVGFGGDLFHTPRSVLTRVQQPVFDLINQWVMESEVYDFLAAAGNHDRPSLSTGSSLSSLFPLSLCDYVSLIVNEPWTRIYDANRDVPICMIVIPYMEDGREVIAAIDRQYNRLPENRGRTLLMLHAGITEAVIGPNEIRINSPITLASIGPHRFDQVFLGHYHHPQTLLDNVHVIGAPLRHNMLDRQDRRGVLLYDPDLNLVSRKWIDSPDFHLIEVNSRNEVQSKVREKAPELTGNYVRVLVTSKTVSVDEVTDALRGCPEQRIAPPKQIDVKMMLTQEAAVRSEELTRELLKLTTPDMATLMARYITHVNPEGMDKRKLLEVGTKIIQESKCQV